MEQCQRCSKKPITLQCFNCPRINRICSLCDKIIHNNTLKIDHVRVPIENVTLNLKDNNIFENKEEPNKTQIPALNNPSNSQNQNTPNQPQQNNITFTKPNERVKTKVNNKI